jgi:hypothetical protein
MRLAQEKWGPALLPAPTAPSEGYAGVRSTLVPPRKRFATPLLDPGSPAQASLPILQLPLARSPADLLDCAARRFAGLSTGPACWNSSPKTDSPAKTARCSAALLGSTPLAFRFALCPERLRAASRWRKMTLPAPLPGWPRFRSEELRHCRPAEIGSSVPSSRRRLAPSWRLGRPPRSLEDHALLPRVAEAKFLVIRLWITGISGTTIGTFRMGR